MILGMSTSTFTLIHVLISLAGIGSGFIFAAKRFREQSVIPLARAA